MGQAIMTNQDLTEEQWSNFDIVSRLVSELLRIDSAKIKLDSKITEDFGADSLDRVNLIVAIEEEFDRKIDLDEAAKFSDIRDILTYLSQQPQQ